MSQSLYRKHCISTKLINGHVMSVSLIKSYPQDYLQMRDDFNDNTECVLLGYINRILSAINGSNIYLVSVVCKKKFYDHKSRTQIPYRSMKSYLHCIDDQPRYLGCLMQQTKHMLSRCNKYLKIYYYDNALNMLKTGKMPHKNIRDSQHNYLGELYYLTQLFQIALGHIPHAGSMLTKLYLF